MIESKEAYRIYLNQDKVVNNVPFNPSVVWRLKNILFPNEEWRFVRAMRCLEYCDNVLKHKGAIGKMR